MVNTDRTYTSSEKNYAICRKELDYIPNGNFISTGYEECRNVEFFKISGLTKFWETEDIDITSLIGDILSSCIRHGVPFAYAITGTDDGIQVYVGTLKVLIEGLKTSYEAVYPGIDIEMMTENPLRTSAREFGGLFTGIPTNKAGAEKKNFQI